MTRRWTLRYPQRPLLENDTRRTGSNTWHSRAQMATDLVAVEFLAPTRGTEHAVSLTIEEA